MKKVLLTIPILIILLSGSAITIYTVLGKSLTIKMVNALYIINLKQLSKKKIKRKLCKI